MASGQVKKEEEVSPAPVSSDDEDLYEDAGDLEFYDKVDPDNENIYSARLPDYLWKKWAAVVDRMGDDDEIRLGTMRTWSVYDANGVQRTKLRMLLNNDIPEHQAAPKEYELEIADNEVKNHFIFSEKDLPRFAAREKARRRAAALDLPMSSLRAKDAGVEKKTGYGKGRYQNNFFQHIPKQTKLVGKIRYELRAEPKDKAEEDRMVMQQLRDMEHPHDSLKILSRNKASAISNVSTRGQQQFQNFIKDTGAQNKPKKGEILKNARMPRNELLDLLLVAFGEYQYWSMKALRQRTQQPDAYLREMLERIAVLNKTGKFANTYSLSEPYKDKGLDAKVEAAQEDDDDDDEEEMEDVV